MVSWKEEYSVGIGELDDQHKSLFDLLDKLSVAIEQEDKLSLGYIVTSLELYVVFHFTSEEHLLAKHGYAGLEKQEKEHTVFREKVAKYKAEMSSGDKIQLAGEIRKYLFDWLVNHIIDLDKKYAPFLIEKMGG
jgi:hemerythrin